MKERYLRNRLYITNNEQNIIKTVPILLAGCGIGSNIAECALRIGFENLTLIDGDLIENSNLNRQNYIFKDIHNYKAQTLHKRLLDINPEASIKYYNEFITEDNIHQIIDGHAIIINALDFTSKIPLLLDEACYDLNLHVLHPYNLGWGALVTVITPNENKISDLFNNEFDELKMVEYVIDNLRYSRKPYKWLKKILEDYKNETESIPPPQLAIGSWMVAAMCTHIMYDIATNKSIKNFPEFYISSIIENDF